MALPYAVKKAGEEARRRHAEMMSSASRPADVVNEKVPAPPVENASAAPDETPTAGNASPPEPEVEASSRDEARPDVSRTDERIELTDWKSRFDLLRSSRDERRLALEQRVRDLEAENETLRSEAPAKDAPVEPSRFEIDPEVRGEMYERDVQVIEGLGKHVDSRLDRLESERRADLAAREEQFFEDLSSLAPEWRELNDDQAFLAWLDAVDPDIGAPRRQPFNRMYAQHNASAVAGLIKLYLTERRKRSSEAQTPPVSNGVSPEPTVNRAAPPGNEERMIEVYSPDEVKAFYAEKNRLYRMGRLQGEVLARIEAEEAKIKQAMAENRVY